MTSKTARTLATAIAAMVAFLAATDPIGIPTWAQGACAVAAVGFAAVGIIPPTMWVNRDHRATTAGRHHHRPGENPNPGGKWPT